MSTQEFSLKRIPERRRGMTSIEAAGFLRETLPKVENWCLWDPEDASLVSRIVSSEHKQTGRVGTWRWEKVACAYPELYYHQSGEYPYLENVDDWTGLIRIYRESKSFYLLSFLGSAGSVGSRFMVSETDGAFLDAFERGLKEFFKAPGGVAINTVSNKSIAIDKNVLDQPVFLTDGMQEQIEEQVFSFFTGRQLFAKLGIPYKRGILFAGKPGLGKTLMTKRLAYQCRKKFNASLWTLIPTHKTDDYDIEELFNSARKQCPAMIILEELDSLITDTSATRATLLSLLDGLTSSEGILVIGTTNNPEKIDAALIHRPSRFDRVWTFGSPDVALRKQYLKHHFVSQPETTVTRLAEETEGWSYAYMNELRITCGIIAAGRQRETLDSSILLETHAVLAEQFHSGRKNHAESDKTIGGFAVV